MQKIKNNEFGYLGNPSVKRDGVETEFSKSEIREYMKCMKDPVYFAKKYVKIISLDEGLVPFDLYPYQQKMFRHFNKNRFSIVLACRQSGKSISSVVYLLWYAVFHPEKTIAILANKGVVAREMLARITLALENLPLDEYRFSVITFESDIYAHGPECRDIQRRILNDLGYQIVARDVANGGNQFEDWWIDPQVIDNVTWGPFISHGAEARSLFIK